MGKNDKGEQAGAPVLPKSKPDPETYLLPVEIGILQPRLDLLTNSKRISGQERARHDRMTALFNSEEMISQTGCEPKNARYLYAGLLARMGWKPGDRVDGKKIIAAYAKHITVKKGRA